MDSIRYSIEPIEEADNASMAAIIRAGLTEFGANRPGFAWQDPEVDQLHQAYAAPGRSYWVARSSVGQVVGGCGIGPLSDLESCCELQKMYVLPEHRGAGLGEALLRHALAFAREHYRWCYLETLASMTDAGRLYRRLGFMALPRPLGNTGHGGCDHWYLIEFQVSPV